MKRGILYFSFGKDCDELAANTIKYSRQFTELPICVITNIKNRTQLWGKIKNIEFIYVDARIENNRDYKTRMIDFTPFDETIYLDCDSVVHNKGLETVFEELKNSDMVLNKYLFWDVGDKIIRLYRTAMNTTKICLPLIIYNGAFICFKKNNDNVNFFLLWNKFWIRTGSGREMPALACALKKSNLIVQELRSGVFSPDFYQKNSLVQHNYTPVNGGVNFFDRFNIPKIKLYKPFDRHESQLNWNWVYE